MGRTEIRDGAPPPPSSQVTGPQASSSCAGEPRCNDESLETSDTQTLPCSRDDEMPSTSRAANTTAPENHSVCIPADIKVPSKDISGNDQVDESGQVAGVGAKEAAIPNPTTSAAVEKPEEKVDSDRNSIDENETTHNDANLADALIPDWVDEFYHQELGRFFSEVYEIRDSSFYWLAHVTLSHALIKIIRKDMKRLRSSGSISDGDEIRLLKLKASLDSKFTQIMTEKVTIVKTKEKLIAHYIGMTEVQLGKHADGIDEIELWQIQKEMNAELDELFKLEIGARIKFQQVTSAHWTSINKCIDGYWNDLRRKNAEKRELKKNGRKQLLEATGTSHPGQGLVAQPSNPNSLKSESGAVPERKQLPPIVFQLGSNIIKMGMMIDGTPQILRTDSGEESIPFVVGLDQAGGLICGSEVLISIAQDGDSFKCWWIAKQLMSPPAEDSTDCEYIQLRDGGLVKVSAEFLLGFLLKSLKGQIETRRNGNSSTAIITIPTWYASTQRRQVKDAGHIAGFDKVYLVNEGAAAANSWMLNADRPQAKRKDPTTILILSENSGMLDASMYDYTSEDKDVFKMVGHRTDYSPEEEKSTAQKVFHRLSGVSKTQSPSKASRILEIKKKCKEMIIDVNHCQVIVSAESEKWLVLLERAGREIGNLFTDPNLNNPVIGGACELSQNPQGIGSRVREWLTFDVIAKRCGETGMDSYIFPKQDLLPEESETVNVTSTGTDGELKIIQVALGRKVSLGVLKGISGLPSDHHLSSNLSISNEGIVEMTGLGCMTPAGGICPLGVSCYWTPSNLELQEITELKYLLDSLTVPKDAGLESAKQELLEACRRLNEQLEAGSVFDISHEEYDLMNDSLAQVVEHSVDMANKPNCTLNEIQGQLEILNKWTPKENPN